MNEARYHKRKWLAEQCGWCKHGDSWFAPQSSTPVTGPFTNSDVLILWCTPKIAELGRSWGVWLSPDMSNGPVYKAHWFPDAPWGDRVFSASTLNDVLVDVFYDALGGPNG